MTSPTHTFLLALSTAAVLAVFVPRAAAADPVALDYRADDPSCPDAGRFADEVSSKLGFVPWNDDAAGSVRVRIGPSDRGFTGTFRAVDGTTRTFDGSTCSEVTANLVVTASAVLDRPSAPDGVPAGRLTIKGAAGPSEVAAVDDGLVEVRFHAGARRIDVKRKAGEGYAAASNGATASAVYLEEVCTTPCTARLQRGRNPLAFVDPDHGNVVADNYIFDQPTTLSLEPRSRAARRWGLLLGGAAVGLGGLALTSAATPDYGSDPNASFSTPLLIGGVVLGIAGALAMYVGFRSHDDFIVRQTP